MSQSNAEPDTTAIPYRRVLESRSVLRAGPRSVTRDLPGGATSDSLEATYWNDKFGFAPSYQSRHKKFAHARSLTIQAGSASVVHQLVLAPTAMAPHNNSKNNDTNMSKHTCLAVACGPRVPLYGTTPQSSFHRLLLEHRQPGTATTTPPKRHNLLDDCDRQIPTSGQLALAISMRTDGRLLAIGTENGILRIIDIGQSSRLALCQWCASPGLALRAVAWMRDGQHVVAAGDDGVLRVWSMNSSNNNSACVVECRGHGDGIRCASVWQPAKRKTEENHGPVTIVATGGYDHTVRGEECIHGVL